MNNERTLVIACETVIEEMLPIWPVGMKYKVLEFGLHIYPDKLRTTLQEAIDQAGDDVDTILLGYGLCSQAMVGINSGRYTLVVPWVDDCISIFLGGRAEYQRQCRIQPGSYYLTKGWIKVGSTPMPEFAAMIDRYGPEKAKRLQRSMLRNYKRLAFINTGVYEIDEFRESAKKQAEDLELNYEEIDGSPAMVKRLLEGDWNDEFIVIPPGGTIRYEDFFPTENKTPGQSPIA